MKVFNDYFLIICDAKEIHRLLNVEEGECRVRVVSTEG